jgi:hypothetical protein
MDSVNPVLLLLFIAQICLGICAARSSRFLRRAAAYLLTRADVIDISKSEGERRKRFWLDELGIGPDGVENRERREHPPIQRLAGR